MKKIIFILAILFSFSAQAAGIKAAIISAPKIKAGMAEEVKFALTNSDGTPTNLDDLQEIHTQKIHVLVIDPSLSDYTHAHPVPAGKPGEYKFSFTPKTNSSYKIWVDITPQKSEHQYIPLQINGAGKTAPIDKTEVMDSAVGEYNFKLSFDSEVKTGEAVMGNLQVSKNGKPFKNLEPVMGAFAHIVGFYEDYATIAHIHPMGAESQTEAARGGPQLTFHIEPAKKGFLKLFAQVKINGEDIFVPFGLWVK